MELIVLHINFPKQATWAQSAKTLEQQVGSVGSQGSQTSVGFNAVGSWIKSASWSGCRTDLRICRFKLRLWALESNLRLFPRLGLGAWVDGYGVDPPGVTVPPDGWVTIKALGLGGGWPGFAPVGEGMGWSVDVVDIGLYFSWRGIGEAIASSTIS